MEELVQSLEEFRRHCEEFVKFFDELYLYQEVLKLYIHDDWEYYKNTFQKYLQEFNKIRNNLSGKNEGKCLYKEIKEKLKDEQFIKNVSIFMAYEKSFLIPNIGKYIIPRFNKEYTQKLDTEDKCPNDKKVELDILEIRFKFLCEVFDIDKDQIKLYTENLTEKYKQLNIFLDRKEPLNIPYIRDSFHDIISEKSLKSSFKGYIYSDDDSKFPIVGESRYTLGKLISYLEISYTNSGDLQFVNHCTRCCTNDCQEWKKCEQCNYYYHPYRDKKCHSRHKLRKSVRGPFKCTQDMDSIYHTEEKECSICGFAIDLSKLEENLIPRERKEHKIIFVVRKIFSFVKKNILVN